MLALAAATLAAAAGASDYDAYIGLVSRPGERVRSGEQGAGWQAVFRERRRGRVRYKVCLQYLASTARPACWTRRTGRSGRSTVSVALYVNDRGGPGPWRASWTVGGRQVASWSFTVREEGA